MNWNDLLSSQRLGSEKKVIKDKDHARSQFQRDYDRIIFSSPFRRLQNKTQVFPLPGSVFVHNRLTHSLEVASVGRSLGNKITNHLLNVQKLDNPLINEIGTIVASACLAHDMGNPPFGHSGEEAISRYFKKNETKFRHLLSEGQWSDLCNFEGNANAFRVLSHQFKGRRPGGFGLTYSTLLSIVKYPYQSGITKKKYGFFQSEKDIYLRIAKELGIEQISDNPLKFKRHPLVFLVEAADDICYQLMDTEDAFKLGILDINETKEIFTAFIDSAEKREIINRTLTEVIDPNEQIAYLRAVAINELIQECSGIFIKNMDGILNGTFTTPLMKELSGNLKKAMSNCIKTAVNKIYKDQSVIEIEIAGYKILGTLLEEFVEAAINPENDYSSKLLRLVPNQYEWNSEIVYDRILSIVDFVSGMTDLFALDLYRKITGISINSTT